MSPILVRPVREQLEHDRIIRFLQSKAKRRYDAGMNPGVEKNVAVGAGAASVYPDLVLYSPEKGKRLQAVVEVETGESVNHLEALAQWAHLARLRAAFHLYVPAGMVDVARRLCEDNQIRVHEIWSFHTIGEDVRFTLVRRQREAAAPGTVHPAPPARVRATPAARRKAPAAKSAKKSAARGKPSKKPAKRQKKR